jgi:hypothetical protein
VPHRGVFVPDENYLVKPRHRRACNRKTGVWTDKRLADEAARRATEKSGIEIISYFCSNCSTGDNFKFHHAKANNVPRKEMITVEWKKVKRVIGTNGVEYVMLCPSGDMKDAEAIYHKADIIAYKYTGEQYKYARPGDHVYPHYMVLGSAAVHKVQSSESVTKLYQELLLTTINPPIKKEIPSVTKIMYGEHEIKKDLRGGHYFDDIVHCKICKVEEPAKHKVTVANGKVTRLQSIQPFNKELIKPKSGSKEWIHKSCKEGQPQPEGAKELMSELVDLSKKPIQRARFPGKFKTHRMASEILGTQKTQSLEKCKMDLSFTSETILDLLDRIDPINDKVSDSAARGMGWLFIKEIAERIMK